MQASKFKSILLETKNFLKALSAGVTLSFFSLNHLPFCSVGRFKRLFGQKPFFHKILCWNYYCLMYLVKNQMASMLKLLCWTVERYLRTIFFIVIISLNVLRMNFIRHMCLSFKKWRQNFYPFPLKT